jgi:hypothetical protein
MEVIVKKEKTRGLNRKHTISISHEAKEKLERARNFLFIIDGKEMTANDILRMKIDEINQLVENRSA